MSAVSIVGVGDVFNGIDGDSALAHVKPLLAQGDVVFGNLEGVHTDRPAKAPTHKHYMGTTVERGRVYGPAGFDVMTCANNHLLDGGYVGMRDTLELLEEQGIAVTGAGEDLAAALAPVVVERGGRRIAFLGFCTTMPKGYEARPRRPGVAPLRVVTSYFDPDENFWEPGIDPVIATIPMPGDRKQFLQTIAAARDVADVVVVAPHWGYSARMELLHDYEIELGRAAVDAGADVVLATHHHSLRPAEIHQGKPIFYGLSALVHHLEASALTDEMRAKGVARFGKVSSFAKPREVFPLWPFAEDTRQTIIAIIDVGEGGELQTGFVPAMMLADGSTEPLHAGDARAVACRDYMQRITDQAGFATAFGLAERAGWAFVRVTPGA